MSSLTSFTEFLGIFHQVITKVKTSIWVIQMDGEYDQPKWVDHGDYYIYTAPQKSPPWGEVRRGRVTGSIVGGCAGHSRFVTSPEQLAREIMGEKKVFTPQQQANIDFGVQVEPIGRSWYDDLTGVKTEEIGLAVPKWNLGIGASVDGLVGEDGILEIKGVKKMYGPLYHPRPITIGPRPPVHIWQTHYDQMQTGMAVLGRKWCDYLVFCPPEDKTFLQRVPWNKVYWEQELYPATTLFIDAYLQPLLAGTNYPLLPRI